jgi:hypothetical protein
MIVRGDGLIKQQKSGVISTMYLTAPPFASSLSTPCIPAAVRSTLGGSITVQLRHVDSSLWGWGGHRLAHHFILVTSHRTAYMASLSIEHHQEKHQEISLNSRNARRETISQASERTFPHLSHNNPKHKHTRCRPDIYTPDSLIDKSSRIVTFRKKEIKHPAPNFGK